MNKVSMVVDQAHEGACVPVEAASALGLTPTQFRVMMGVRLGLLNKQIAGELGIAEKTVKAHMTAVMRKLGVTNRTQVALMAQTLAQTVAQSSGQAPIAAQA